MIKRLSIHRFRGIREGALEGMAKINLLIGPNNSGKSAVLEMLYLGGVSGRECQLILENQVFEATTVIERDFLGYAPLPRLRERHGISGRWVTPGGYLTPEGGLGITLAHLPASHSLHAFRLGATLAAPGEPEQSFAQKDLEQVALFALAQQKGIPADLIPPRFVEQGMKPEENRWHVLWQPEWVYEWERQEGSDHLAIWAEAGKVPAASHVLFCDFHTTDRHFTPDFAAWAYNHIPDWHEKIAQSLGGVFPDLKGAIVEVLDSPQGQEGKTVYIRFPGKTPLAVDHFGDGTRHAFKLFASLIALAESADESQPALFLWEDPELFMHPASLGRVLAEVVRLLAHKPVQMFLSTQSLEVLAWFINAMERDELPSMDIRTFHLTLEHGRLQSRPFVGKALAHWLELSGDPRMVGEDEMASPLASLLYRYRTEGA